MCPCFNKMNNFGSTNEVFFRAVYEGSPYIVSLSFLPVNTFTHLIVPWSFGVRQLHSYAAIVLRMVYKVSIGASTSTNLISVAADYFKCSAEVRAQLGQCTSELYLSCRTSFLISSEYESIPRSHRHGPASFNETFKKSVHILYALHYSKHFI